MTTQELPLPTEDGLAQSALLSAHIASEIRAAGGWISFDRFMQLALYTPGLGYYSGGSAKLGPGGDFTTSAALGPFLPAALARFFLRALDGIAAPTILELGAGTGQLADLLIDELLTRGQSSFRYLILEPSAELQDRQQRLLEHHGTRVVWIQSLPDEPFEGVIFGNEVADALPVVRFQKFADQVAPVGVVCKGETFGSQLGPASSELSAAVAQIEGTLGYALPNAYQSEVCLLLRPWIASLSAVISRGGLLLIDYGMTRHDYYRTDRNRGTLIGHYRQRAIDDPFLWPGLQDLSAWVDFSAAADAAEAVGLALSGYTTQAQFLLETLSAEPALLTEPLDPTLSSALKTLVLPGEMGEKFKLLWLSRNTGDCPLPGRDFRGRL